MLGLCPNRPLLRELTNILPSYSAGDTWVPQASRTRTRLPQLSVGLAFFPEKDRQAEVRAGVLRSLHLEDRWVGGRQRGARNKENCSPVRAHQTRDGHVQICQFVWLGCCIGALGLALRHSVMARKSKRPLTPQRSPWESLLPICGILQGVAPQVSPPEPSSVNVPPALRLHPPCPTPLHRQMTDDRRLSHTWLQRSAVVVPPTPRISGGGDAFPLEDGPLPIRTGTLYLLILQRMRPELCIQPALNRHLPTAYLGAGH